MTKKEKIQAFLSTREFAIAGVSRNKQKFGYTVFNELSKKGYTVYPINPNTDEIDGHKCYRSIKELPGNVNRLLIMTPKGSAIKIINEANTRGFDYIWFNQKSESKEALRMTRNDNTKIITNECILMFADPVEGFHKFHRFVRKVFGKLPK
ncbi:MAG: CoA-binding protein [Bacteroidota bacterium]